jgi:hypothetical protein
LAARMIRSIAGPLHDEVLPLLHGQPA